MLRTNVTAQAIDEMLAESFPASDPPAWTPGMARPAPDIAVPPAASLAVDGIHGGRASDVIAVSRPSPGGFPQAVASVVGASGLALVVPLAVLAIGAPLALAVRGVLEAAGWFLAAIR